MHKLKALLAGRKVIDHTLEAVRLSGLPWHLEAAEHAGMGDTIAAAVRATPQATGWLILPADLPLIQPETLCRIATEWPEAPTLRPSYQMQSGHPVRFGAVCGPALMDLRGDGGAASVLKAYGSTLLEVDDPGCVMDIDTVDDLVRAEVLLAARLAATASKTTLLSASLCAASRVRIEDGRRDSPVADRSPGP
jgi:molybdenum cofactor cytidylyltransferase